MSKKAEMEIFDKFKALEEKLIDILKTIPKSIDEENKGSEKKNIESYSKKVKKARELFDEYEALANKLNEMNSKNENDNDSIEISKTVIESRKLGSFKINEKELLEQYKAMSKQTKGLETVEIEAMGEQVIVKKKKKGSATSSSKEL